MLEKKWEEQVKFATWLARAHEDDIRLGKLEGGKTIAYVLAIEMIKQKALEQKDINRQIMMIVPSPYFSDRDSRLAHYMLQKLGRNVG